ncbi:MAG: hypothetical protein JO309_01555 [Pseudonocardiales bacterium]|nr:hypothetical protein [Hyphomicrobiales bacterium]MBV8825507.1 hypothetical protein [Hyphomicrobiales bacterium]MBV9429433.1 hypothetical protein [Bradyrhizobiaceae bacterium]MBV9728101.1 hypothetical protein [Pseudonocardiales bacterium]
MTLSFEAQLTSAPYAGTIIPSNRHPAVLDSEDDFAAAAQFARRSWAPVLMSFAQRHAFMARVFEKIRTVLADRIRRVVLHGRVPHGERMPPELASEGVFIVTELQPEVIRLTQTGESFLTFYEGFVRHPMEIGNNDVRIEWHNFPEDGPARFAALGDELLALGLTKVAVTYSGRAA